MVNLSRHKKGSAADLFYIVIGFFVVAVVGILVSATVTRFNTELNKVSNVVMPTEAKQTSNDLKDVMPNTLNGALLFLFFGACIVALILASLTPMHPVFFVFFILELILLIFFGGGIANSFQHFIETPALAVEAGQYGLIIFMFRYMPFIIGIVGFLLAAIMYKVNSNSQGGF